MVALICGAAPSRWGDAFAATPGGPVPIAAIGRGGSAPTCPQNFSNGSALPGPEHRPLVPLEGLRQALICRYPGSLHGVSEEHPSAVGELLAQRLLHRRAQAKGLAREIDQLHLYPSGEFHCPGAIAPGVYIKFLYRKRATIPITVFLLSCPRVVSGPHGEWHVLTEQLKRKLRALTPKRDAPS